MGLQRVGHNLATEQQQLFYLKKFSLNLKSSKYVLFTIKYNVSQLNILSSHSKCFLRYIAQSCLTLCHPMDSTVCGILQARILEWVAILFSRHLPNPGIKPRSPTFQADSRPFVTKCFLTLLLGPSQQSQEVVGIICPCCTDFQHSLNHPFKLQFE